MAGESDEKDKQESRKIALALSSIILITVIGTLLLWPAFSEIVSGSLSPGLGLRDAAVVAFFVAAVLMIVLTITAGDGLIGEVQFVIPGFLLFYLIIWLFIAWIF